MKYNGRKEVRDNSFFGWVITGLTAQIKDKDWTKFDIENIEIKTTFDGDEVDIKALFERMWEARDEMIEKRAKEIAYERYHQRMMKFEDAMDSFLNELGIKDEEW